MKVVATQDLGSLGRAEGVPVLTPWRWHYNVPSLPIWIALLLMVVVPKHNRHWQAWLILLLPLLAAGFSLLIEALIPGADIFGQFVTALAIAWTGVWLLAPWLQRGNQVRRLLQVCAVMVAVGVVAYLGFYGAWVSSDITWPAIGFWAACSISLVAAAALTGLCCRGQCGPQQLLFWPMLWLPAASAVCVGVVMIVVLLVAGIGGEFSAMNVLGAIFYGFSMSLLAAGALYVFDLPVLLLRILSPCYRERFRGVFCPSGSLTPTAATSGKLESEGVAASPFRV